MFVWETEAWGVWTPHEKVNTKWSTLNSSNKKPDAEASALKKKVNKGKTEGSENSDLDKTPPPSPPPEDDEDPGVQVIPLFWSWAMVVERG